MFSLAFESLSLRERVLTAAALISVVLMLYLNLWYEPLRRSLLEEQLKAGQSEQAPEEASSSRNLAFVEIEKGIANAPTLTASLNDMLASDVFSDLYELEYFGSSQLPSYSSGALSVYAHSLGFKFRAAPEQLVLMSEAFAKRSDVQLEKLVWSKNADGVSGDLLLSVKVFNHEANAFASEGGAE